MKKLIGLGIVIFFAVLATVPGWSLIGFSQSLAKNQQVVEYIFTLLTIVIVAVLLIVAYNFLFAGKN